MLFTDIIRRKRDGGVLSDEEIQFFVDGLADESLPAEQVSALAMAIFLNSMSFDEAATLTLAMARSGTILEWDPNEFDGPVMGPVEHEPVEFGLPIPKGDGWLIPEHADIAHKSLML